MNYNNNLDIDQLKWMLVEMGQLAEQSSLTGANKGGALRLAKHYNAILAKLKSEGVDAVSLFEPIDEDTAQYGQIGVESHMLNSALASKDRQKRVTEDGSIFAIAPFLDSKDLELLVQEKLDEGFLIPDGMLPAIAPFVSREFLGKIIRDRLRKSAEPKPEPEPQPEPKPSTTFLAVPHEDTPEAIRHDSVEELQDLLARLSRSGMDPIERERAEEMIHKVVRELGSRL